MVWKVEEIGKNIKKNPWPFVVGGGAGLLFLLVALSKKGKDSTSPSYTIPADEYYASMDGPAGGPAGEGSTGVDREYLMDFGNAMGMMMQDIMEDSMARQLAWQEAFAIQQQDLYQNLDYRQQELYYQIQQQYIDQQFRQTTSPSGGYGFEVETPDPYQGTTIQTGTDSYRYIPASGQPGGIHDPNREKINSGGEGMTATERYNAVKELMATDPRSGGGKIRYENGKAVWV